MRKIIGALFMCCLCASAHAFDLSNDTSDPLFLQTRTSILSKTSLDYFSTGFRLGQYLSYGLTDNFVLGGRVHYQQDFDSNQDGFSSIDLGGIYRLGTASETENRIIYDVLMGLKFGGSKNVRTPDYADSTYYLGFRLGRQYSGVTFAGTVKSSWIFDDVPRGMAFIDFIPEVYFRVSNEWRVGANFALRKATNPHYDEESLGLLIAREYGRTQYVGHVEYAFEGKEVSAGARINLLF